MIKRPAMDAAERAFDIASELGIADAMDLEANGASHGVYSPAEIEALLSPCVYALIARGSVLYIGSSANGISRFVNHQHLWRQHRGWCRVHIWRFGTVDAARACEARMIRKYRPPLNRQIPRYAESGEPESVDAVARTEG